MTTSEPTVRIKRGQLNGELCNMFRDKLKNQILSLPGQSDPRHDAPDHQTPRKMVLPNDSIFLYAETGCDSNPTPIGALALIQVHPDEPHFRGLSTNRDKVGEMKRMIVFDDYQRLGVGRQLIEAMEVIARDELGLRYLVVETSEVLAAAQRLYLRCGYRRREVWGLYREESFCYEKWL